MISPSLKLDKRTAKGKRLSAEAKDAAMSVAHLSDTIGGYNLPHVLTHAKTGVKSKDIAQMRKEFVHIIGHGTDAAKASKKMRRKVDLLPGVKAENKRLDAHRKKAYK